MSKTDAKAQIRKTDSKGRISLNLDVNSIYLLKKGSDGTILLQPVAVIPKSELVQAMNSIISGSP
jgi:hypothetical protein